MKQKHLTYRAPVILALALLLAGCGGPPPTTPELYWPPPPQEPRIEYVRSFYGNQDLQRSFFGKIKDFLFGRSTRFVIGKPYGVVYDGKSKIYLADTAKKGILVLDVTSGTTSFFNSLGKHGKLAEPVYLQLDDDGYLYVSDTRLKRVAVFDPEHKFVRFIGSETDLEGPVGMTWDRSRDRLLIVDTQSHAVKIFDREGRFVSKFGERGDGPGQFYFPTTVAVADDGTIYVVDSFHFAVQAFSPDGEFLFSFGSTAVALGSLARPRDIAMDSDGHLYVTDAIRNNVQVFERQGNLLMTFGRGGHKPGEFQLPAGIFVDGDDNIYVSDSINRRIQVFRYLAEK
jgi:DNA-binding beta-propeller fold protein YncE